MLREGKENRRKWKIPHAGEKEAMTEERKAEAALIKRLVEDPQRGMEEAVEKYTGLLWTLAGSYLENPEDIKECVNEAFMALYENRERYNPTLGSLKAFLGGIVKNIAVSRFRKNAVREGLRLNGDPVDPTDCIAQAETSADIERAIAALKPEDGEIIRKKYYGGMTVQEIAQSMGLPYETVKKRHQRILRKLQKLLMVLIILGALILMTACAYMMLRYFGIVPGYGVSTDPRSPVYVLASSPERCRDCTIENAFLLDRSLYIRIKTECEINEMLSHVDNLLIEGKTWSPCGFSMVQCPEGGTLLELDYAWEEPEGPPLGALPESSDSAEGYGSMETLDITLNLDGTLIEFELVKPEIEEIRAYSHEIGRHGGLLAIPRIEDGRLLVGIYALNTGEESIMTSLLRGVHMEGLTGTVTVEDKEGRKLEGECQYEASLNNGKFFYDWDFGPAEPGEYDLHVPYVYLSAPLEETIEFELDLEQDSWESWAVPVTGGTLSLENFRRIYPLQGEVIEGSDMIAEEGCRYWALKLRYEPEEDLTLTSCLITKATSTTEEEEVQRAQLEGRELERESFRISSLTDLPEENCVEILLAAWPESPSKVRLEVKGPLSLRWNRSFDLPLTVKEEPGK